jgi:hypothetical protein
VRFFSSKECKRIACSLQYYARALGSPFGQRVRAFYTSTSKQVQDIHEEARRISTVHKSGTVAPAPGSVSVEEKGSSK